jgi:hypothetical protein
VTRTQPPTIAAWLLRHLGCSPNNDAVIGDLDERYQRGRSRKWYWRQVLVAIGESVLTDSRLHKLSVFRGLVIGNVFKIVSLYSLAFIVGYLARYQPPWETPNLLLFSVISAILLCAVNGRLLASLCRPYRKTIVFAFVLWQLIAVIPFIGYIAAPFSWILEVDHRLHSLLWNTYGMTALDRACRVCTSQPWHGPLFFWTSALITMASLLIGSGIFMDRESNSDVQPERAAT